jgi:adenylate cyclase
MDPNGHPDSETAWEEGAERLGHAELQFGGRVRALRRRWRAVPSAPRCKMCYSPFGAPGGPILRLIGKGRWPGNPKYCGGCFKDLYRTRVGAEIECTLLFADIRGSTALAESMDPSAFRGLVDRFYQAATAILVEHEAIVDKFAGDEVIAIFIPALAGADHARGAVDSALELLRATGHEADAPWAPLGIGVNTGRAYVGVVGTAEHLEFTALGDTVNVTARLASAAGRGEVLLTDSAMQASGGVSSHLEQRQLDLRGKSVITDVHVLTLASD